MCAPKLRTPGIARSSLLARWVMRQVSACEVPSAGTQCIRKSRSLKSGSSPWPRNGHSARPKRSEEHTSELQSLRHLVCRLLLEKKKKQTEQTIEAIK